ncbi:winged helix-turn-helix transcriptional regulator [Flavobacterium saccharophilum]|uniref:Transcriptional regulator, HxlR family n=1 Tax=Flavobacterium saccharophilum TaxID=29534 RepID=A0A1M7D298_9FLAO|nr:helix-turn-helix domain-containing protein [Flavobacterium saccharophilum]SHL73555.1 transcriptional regulator, HxlR family [Flavobacterium saccharophilum]
MNEKKIEKNTVEEHYTEGDAFFSCHVELANKSISGKWKILILYRLSLSPLKRYTELRKELGAISEKVLSNQLKDLENDGLVQRTVYPVVPPKVEYRLTENGKGIIPVIIALRNFGCFLKHRN